jgi:glucosamine--fructose-6-phosphate aminotransferase (isomerizing)
MTHLQREINEQADVIANFLTVERDNVRQIAQAIREFNPTFITIAARGTSDNAARYAQYLFGSKAGLQVALSAPSLHTLYEAPPNLGRALVIGISQSGRAEDVRRVLTDAKAQGALTLSITNNPESPMATSADHHINISAGEEVSIAATKTYTAQLTAVAVLVAELTADSELLSELDRLPDNIRATLANSASINDWAERYRYMSQFVTIGRGYNYATAFEINLKVKELSYIIGEGYSEADFRHGPIALIQTGFPVIVVATKGKVLANVVDLLAKLQERGAELIVISNDDEALSYGQKQVVIPDVPDWISPILTIIPGQIFAMNQAIVRGLEVDKPRGLSKVTVTQ